MSTDAVIGAAAALVGALIGSFTTLSVQRLMTRHTERIDHRRRIDELRYERRRAVEAYISTAQEIEQFAGRPNNVASDHSLASRLHRELWAFHKSVFLVASPALELALTGLSDRLTSAIWEGTAGRPAHEYLWAEMHTFLSIAKQEAGVGD